MNLFSRLDKKLILGAGIGAVSLLALGAAPGMAQGPATSPTRADYIAQADPICQEAYRTKLPKVHGKNDIKGYIKVFHAMGNRIGSMADRIDPIPKPIADEAALTNWLKSLHHWAGGALGAERALRHRNLHGFKASLRRMNRAQKIRRSSVKTFGFRIC